MKLTIPHGALGDVVGVAARILPAHPPVPVLAGLQLEATGGQLTVSAFDYETSVKVATPVDLAGPGKILVPGRLLSDIAKRARGTVTLHADDGNLTVEYGNCRFALPALPLDEYPSLPAPPAASGTVDAAEFAVAVAKVALAAGSDDTVPILTGIGLAVADGQLTLVATDRYRINRRAVPYTAVSDAPTSPLIVPAKSLTDLAKSLPSTGQVTLALPPTGAIGITSDGVHATSRCLDGKLPPYDGLIPTDFVSKVVIDSAPFGDAVRSVALVAEGKSSQIQLDVTSGSITIRGGTRDTGRGSARIDAELTGDPMTIAFNSEYLLSGLDCIDANQVELRLTTPTKPALMVAAKDTEPSTWALIMPIRVTG